MATVRVCSGEVGTVPYRFVPAWLSSGNRGAHKRVKRLLSAAGVSDNELAGKDVHMNKMHALADSGWHACAEVP